MPILTFVTPEPKAEFDLWVKQSHPEIKIRKRTVIDPYATRWETDRVLTKDRMDFIRKEFHIDVFQTEEENDIRLLIADMDATIVEGETLDDMAAMAGIGDEIAAITDRAMRGELDFKQALTERVKRLQGYPAALIDRVLNSMVYSSGVAELMAHLKARKVHCVLVSGGFTQFTARVAADLGFDAHFGNTLCVEDGIMTGAVAEPILDKNFKYQKLLELKARQGITAEQVMAIGDGANDVPMLEAAGVGIAYHAKPIVRDAIANRIDYTDLKSLMYLV